MGVNGLISRLGAYSRHFMSCQWCINHFGMGLPVPQLILLPGSRTWLSTMYGRARPRLGAQLCSDENILNSSRLTSDKMRMFRHPWASGFVKSLGTTSVRVSGGRHGGRKTPEDRDDEDDDAVAVTMEGRLISGRDDLVSGNLLAPTDEGATRSKAPHWRSKQTTKRNDFSKKRDLKSFRGKDILYGIAPCLLALEGDRRTIGRVFVTPSFKVSTRPEAVRIWRRIEEEERLGGVVEEVGREDLDRVTRGRPHQGVALLASRLRFEPLPDEHSDEDESRQGLRVYLCLEQIMDPMNLGAILRSAYYLGVDRVVASQRSCCSLTPVVSKASSGVMEVMPVHATNNMQSFVQMQREKGWDIVGATSISSSQGSLPVSAVTDLAVSKPVALVVGSEGSGLSEGILQECTHLVTVQAGRQLPDGIDSLNVSVAVGILLQAFLHRRGLHQ